MITWATRGLAHAHGQVQPNDALQRDDGAALGVLLIGLAATVRTTRLEAIQGLGSHRRWSLDPLHALSLGSSDFCSPAASPIRGSLSSPFCRSRKKDHSRQRA